MEVLLAHSGEENSRFTISGETISPELNQFFEEMANPTLKTLEQVTARLTKLPYDDLLGTLSMLYGATYESAFKKSLIEQGIPEDQAEKIEEGVIKGILSLQD